MTAQTVGGAVRDAVIAWGQVNQRAWADNAPPKPSAPYATISDAIGVDPALAGDGKVMWWARTVQVSLWQAGDAYTATMVNSLVAFLDGRRQTYGTGKSVRLRVTGWNRLAPEPDTNIIQVAVTLTVTHDRSSA